MTLGERLDLAHGRPSGFDYLRIILAAAVICYHSVSSTQGFSASEALFSSNLVVLLKPIVPMFFGLSGFLVAGSAFRCRSLVSFVGLRVLRIIPALGVEIFISSLVLGPIVTVSSLSVYFTSSSFYAYFLNIIGWIHYSLPGVFVNNPFPNIVNGQLWTVPHELECYVILTVLCFLGAFWRKIIFIMILILLQISIGLYVIIMLPPSHTLVNGRVLVLCFLVGAALYVYRHLIAFKFTLLLISLFVSAVLMLSRNGDFFIALPLVYVTVYIGLLSPPRSRFLLGGDYSYGMYLYGYPIQQTAAAICPGISWYVSILISLPLAFLIAYCSWWRVEKPVLQLRQGLLRLEERILGRLPKSLQARLTPRSNVRSLTQWSISSSTPV